MSKRQAARRVWLFDLDNTLHNASHAIFPAINRNMNAYIADLLGGGGAPADSATVNALRQEYYVRYGVTMLGLVRHHGVRAEEFLQQAHSFPDLPSMIRAERGLARLFRRLPGEKILLTNAPMQYSQQVLRHLRVHRQFSQHIPVEQMKVHGHLKPKPSRSYLRRFLARHGYRARDCVLVEDSLENLRAARQEGLRTVWVNAYLPAAMRAGQPPRGRAGWVDVRLPSVMKLIRHSRRLG